MELLSRLLLKIHQLESISTAKSNDLQNGKYEILFTSAPSFFRSCDDIGELHITVDDTAIQDSPYNIKFINYNRAISPSETFAIDDAPEYLDSAGNLLYCITTNQEIYWSIDEYDTPVYFSE